MKLLIIGGSGYIGQKFIRFLINKNFKILNIDLVNSHIKHKNLKSFLFDYRNDKSLNKVLSKYKIDIVYHFASKKSLSSTSKDSFEYFDINSFAIANLLTNIKKYNIKKFFFSSCSSVYGNNDFSYKSKETDKLNPINKRGLSKVFAEKIIIDLCKTLKINFFIARYFNVIDLKINYNPKYKNENLSDRFKKNLIYKKIFFSNEKISITEDNTLYRDYIDINDVLSFNYKSLKYLKNGKSIIINCGSSNIYSVKYFDEFFNKNNNTKTMTHYKKKDNVDISYSIANISKAKKILNWVPKKTL